MSHEHVEQAKRQRRHGEEIHRGERLPVTFTCTAILVAACISNCRDDYESAVDTCKTSYGDDPDDADDFQTCVQDAKDEYNSCDEQCEEDEEDE